MANFDEIGMDPLYGNFARGDPRDRINDERRDEHTLDQP